MGLYGIISVLDGTHYQIVKELWADIDRAYGPRSLVPHPFPHVTYQTAEDYDLTTLNEILRTIATRSAPFRLVTTGLSIFNGGSTVYISVPRTPQLARFQADLWSEVGRAARTSLSASTSPENWAPHITLALGPQIREKVPDIVGLLYRRNLAWTVEVNNLTVVYEDDIHKELISRHDFPSATDPPPPL